MALSGFCAAVQALLQTLSALLPDHPAADETCYVEPAPASRRAPSLSLDGATETSMPDSAQLQSYVTKKTVRDRRDPECSYCDSWSTAVDHVFFFAVA